MTRAPLEFSVSGLVTEQLDHEPAIAQNPLAALVQAGTLAATLLLLSIVRLIVVVVVVIVVADDVPAGGVGVQMRGQLCLDGEKRLPAAGIEAADRTLIQLDGDAGRKLGETQLDRRRFVVIGGAPGVDGAA